MKEVSEVRKGIEEGREEVEGERGPPKAGRRRNTRKSMQERWQGRAALQRGREVSPSSILNGTQKIKNKLEQLSVGHSCHEKLGGDGHLFVG